MKDNKQHFSRFGFIVSAIGSAVGLGSIWRFPTIMAKSGGGAFLIPFIIAMLLCGIPILAFEMNVGNHYRKTQLEIFTNSYGKAGKFLGFFYPTIASLIGTFYSVIIAWIVIQFGMSFSNNLFIKNFLFEQAIGSPKNGSFLGLPSVILIIAVVIVYGIAVAISLLGIKSGVQKLNKVLVPLLFIIVIILTIYAVTLPGAHNGLNQMWKPQWKELANSTVWKNAFSQTFFSLSLAMGPIMYYSSRTNQSQDNNNSALIVALPLILISILPGIMVFASLGYLSFNTGESITKLIAESEGPTLVFNIYPQIFNEIAKDTHHLFAKTLAILFYLSLFFAAITSFISLGEVAVGNIASQSNVNRNKAIFWVYGLMFLISFFFCFQGGDKLIEGLDIWVNNIWLFIIGFIQVFLLVFTIKNYKLKTSKLWNETVKFSNDHSWIKLGRWFQGFLCVALLLLLVSLGFSVASLIDSFDNLDATKRIVYLYFGLPVGFGLQLILPLFLTFKGEIFNGIKAMQKQVKNKWWFKNQESG